MNRITSKTITPKTTRIRPVITSQIKSRIIILLFIAVYFLLLQSINVPIYWKNQNKNGSTTFYLVILDYVMVFLPLIILIFKIGIEKNLIMLQSMLRKYWIPYLIYVCSVYLIRQQVILGYYYIDMGIGGLVFWLTKSPASDFLMMDAFLIFQSYISLLFFLALPFYTSVLHSYIFRIKKENIRRI